MPEKLDYENDPVFQRMQYQMRATYEEAWRDAGGDPTPSPADEFPKGWRAAWMNSKSRDFLVQNGLITGKDNYK